MKKVRVRLGSNSYVIHIGLGMLAHAGRQLKKSGLAGKLVIITNPVVQELYGAALEQELTGQGFVVNILPVPDGEEQKSLEAAGKLYHELSNIYAERTTPIVALGGGVIGDLAGFVAATYLRGVPLVQIPTTLLAQVDSSIGGKVAVNHGRLKNEIGAFYQPKLVLADTGTLKTLPAEELANGLAEVIKCAVIADNRLFAYLERNLAGIGPPADSVLEEIVFRTARIKAAVVSRDERDAGLRNILNYGHTIGHALESASDFQMRHGEAVAIGMLAAARISYRMDIFGEKELLRLKGVIEKAGLPTEVPDLKLEQVMQAMEHDKKVLRGRVRFVLPRKIGSVFITDEVNLSLVEKVLEHWHEET